MEARSIIEVPLSELTIDTRLQMRASIDQEIVADYAEHVGDLPPVWAVREGEILWLTDGGYRTLAHRKAGRDKIKVAVAEGTFLDAVKEAAGSNDAHGLRRTSADKRMAIMAMLSQPEWSERSDRWIAEQCRVSDKTVAAVRKNDEYNESTADFRSSNNNHTQQGDASENSEQDEDAGAENHKPTRTGRDGKKRTARKKKPKYTTKGFDKNAGKKIDEIEYMIGERVKLFGEHPQHEACLAAVAALREAYSEWSEKTSGVVTKKFDPTTMQLPPNLDTAKFKLSWFEWCDYRAGKRKPITAKAAKKQLKEMSECGLEAAIEAIDDAIKNDYQGVFPKKRKSKEQFAGIKSWLENSDDEE